MQTIQTVPASITVSGPLFAAWQKAAQAATAAKKEADALKAQCGFPETEDLVKLLRLPKGGKGDAVIQDGNGKPIGKLSVFWKDAYEVKAGFCSRVS